MEAFFQFDSERERNTNALYLNLEVNANGALQWNMEKSVSIGRILRRRRWKIRLQNYDRRRVVEYETTFADCDSGEDLRTASFGCRQQLLV